MPVKSRNRVRFDFSASAFPAASAPRPAQGNKSNKKMARIAFSQFSCGRYERAKRARPSQGRA
jgi:hypothetical protein